VLIIPVCLETCIYIRIFFHILLCVYKACIHIHIDARVHCTYYCHSPTSGISLYVDGHHHCSQYKPTITTSTKPTTSPPTPNPLCMGSCGSPHGTHQNNATLSNLGIANTGIPSLLSNSQLGNLSNVLICLIVSVPNT